MSESYEKTVKIGGQQVPMSEVSLHVMNLLKSKKGLDQDIIISGADIEKNFVLLGEHEEVDCVLTFVDCHFRLAILIQDYAFRNVSFQNTKIDETISIKSCTFAEQLYFKDIESGTVTLEQINAAKLIATDVSLSADSAFAFQDCVFQSAFLYGIKGNAVTVTGSRFDELKVAHNPVRQVKIEKSEGKRLIAGGGSELTLLSLRDVTLENELSIATHDSSPAARLLIEDCVIGGKLRVAGKDARHQGAKLEVHRTSIEGECIISNPEISTIQLNRLELHRLRLSGAVLSELSLRETKIARNAEIHKIDMDGRLEIEDTAIEGRLDLYGVRQSSGPSSNPHDARQSSHALVIDRGTIGEIECRDCFLLSTFDIRESNITGAFKLNDCRLEQFVIENATIQQQIRLTDCCLVALQIERGRAEGLHLALVRRKRMWRGLGSLSLRDSHLGRLSFISYAESGGDALLPAAIDMSGCTYDDLPRFTRDEDAGQRTAFCRTLISRGPYNPQPYAQMSRMLRSQGHTAAANEIMFRERVAATRNALSLSWRHFRNWDWLLWLRATANWAWLWVLRATIGFGIGLRYFRTVPWALAFVLMGAVVLTGSEPVGLAPSQSWLWRLGASLDQLLPLVKLSPKYAAFFEERSADVLNFWQNAYFTLHRFAGWLLGTFIVAGLAGLTQRPAGG
jgi:uncharacterized protein YjbI with pentapeptide repeats